jgi:prepilin-type N-terminal cleavage/methylation domain-containing protein
VRRNGFSLIEVSVMLTLLAVVATVGVFVYRGAISATQQQPTIVRLQQAAAALESEHERTGAFTDSPEVLASLSPGLAFTDDPGGLTRGEGVAVRVLADGGVGLAALDHENTCLLLRLHPPGTRTPSATGYGPGAVCDPESAAMLDGRQW